VNGNRYGTVVVAVFALTVGGVALTPTQTPAICGLGTLIAMAVIGLMKVQDLVNISRSTHTLVNSKMGDQLYISAVLAERLADITKNEQDRKAAQMCRRLYNEHQTKQTDVDKRLPL
jgi:hypothetical protein